MCRAPVGRVIGIEEGRITIDCNGKTRCLNSKLVNVKKGDYVLFSADIAIDKIDKEEAEMILGNVR